MWHHNCHTAFITDSAGVQSRPQPKPVVVMDFRLLVIQPHVPLVCRLMVPTSVIHVNTH